VTVTCLPLFLDAPEILNEFDKQASRLYDCLWILQTLAKKGNPMTVSTIKSDEARNTWAALLISRSAEMDSDPNAAIPWDSVKEGMKERGLLDA
jgi:hypothetical protein